MKTLPLEILKEIAGFAILKSTDFGNISLISRKFHTVISSSAGEFVDQIAANCEKSPARVGGKLHGIVVQIAGWNDLASYEIATVYYLGQAIIQVTNFISRTKLTVTVYSKELKTNMIIGTHYTIVKGKKYPITL